MVVTGGREKVLGESGRLVLPNMSPGEHRWVRLTLHPGDDAKQESVVVFKEMVGGLAVNGFAVAVQLYSEAVVSQYLLGRALSRWAPR